MWLRLSQVPLYPHCILSTCWLGECEHDYCSAISLHHGVPGPDLTILANDSSIAARSLFVAPQDATRENGPLLQCQRSEDLFTMLWLPRDHRGVYPRYGMHLNIRLVSNPATPDHNHQCLPCSMPYAFPPQLPLNRGYTIRPCEIPPIDTWKPASEFHDAAKVNGLDFAATIRSSKFTSYKDIEGMDPLQVPLWKFLYRGLHNRWLQRIAHGRETYIIPFDNILYSLPSSSANFGPATLILTDLQLTDLETRAPTTNRRKQSNRWRRTWPNTFNHGFPLHPPRTPPANNASWNLRRNSPK